MSLILLQYVALYGSLKAVNNNEEISKMLHDSFSDLKIANLPQFVLTLLNPTLMARSV